MKLLVYDEKRQKPRLICLQYASLYSTTQVLFEIFQISLHMVPNKINQGDFKTPIEDKKALKME